MLAKCNFGWKTLSNTSPYCFEIRGAFIDTRTFDSTRCWTQEVMTWCANPPRKRLTVMRRSGTAALEKQEGEFEIQLLFQPVIWWFPRDFGLFLTAPQRIFKSGLFIYFDCDSSRLHWTRYARIKHPSRRSGTSLCHLIAKYHGTTKPKCRLFTQKPDALL